MNKVFKEFSKYVSSNIIGMIGLSFYILIDTFFISKALGSVGLAALNFGIPAFSVLNGIGLMLGVGGATRFSISKSENGKKSNSVFVHSLLLGAVFAIGFVVIGLFFAEPLSRFLGADDVAIDLTKTYASTILIFSPFSILNNITSAFVRNDNAPRLAMTAMLLSSLSNIMLDYILLFVFPLGIFGAAFSTGFSSIVSLLVLSIHFIRKKNTFKIEKCKIRFSAFKDIVSLGISSFITELASAVSLATFNVTILKIEGNVGVAAYGIIANIALVVNAIFVGIAQGIQPLASRFFGKKDKDMLKTILKYSIVLTVIISVIMYVVVTVFANPIIDVFNSEGDSALALIANYGMKIYFVGFFFAGINIIACSFLSATENYKRAMVISVLRSCVLIVPSVILLGALFKMTGIWISFDVTEFTVLIISVISMKSLVNCSLKDKENLNKYNSIK